MHHSPGWYRLVWITVIGLVITGLLFYGLVQFWGGNGITRPGWLFLWLWTGMMLLTNWGMGEYRRRQYRRDRRHQQREHQYVLEQQLTVYQALEQQAQNLEQELTTYRPLEQQLQEQTQQIQRAERIIDQIEELEQERDRLTTQLQDNQAQAQDTERLFEEYCSDLEQQNQKLKTQLKDLKHQNWVLTQYPNCPQPDAELSRPPDTGELDEQDVDHPDYIPLSKLTNISGRQAVRALEKLGFAVESQTGSHIKLKRPHTIVCIVPNHPEVSPPTLKNILQQADVDISAFLEVL